MSKMGCTQELIRIPMVADRVDEMQILNDRSNWRNILFDAFLPLSNEIKSRLATYCVDASCRAFPDLVMYVSLPRHISR